MAGIGQMIYHNIDLLWVPVALLAMERGKRLATCGFVLSCALLLRLQSELLVRTGHADGFLDLIDMPARTRGQIVYSLFIALFLILAYFSPRSSRVIHLAASITMLIAGFCVSTLVMAL